jgi:hypothetical protein
MNSEALVISCDGVKFYDFRIQKCVLYQTW